MRLVQLIPSDDVITRLLIVPAAVLDTATKIPFAYVTASQSFAAEALREVQVIPSGEVITRLTPVEDTATKRPLP